MTTNQPGSPQDNLLETADQFAPAERGGTVYLEQVEAGLAKLADRPALIVWGTQDFAFREAERARFEALFPDHETVLLEGASHFLQEDAGEEIAAAFRAFRAKRSHR